MAELTQGRDSKEMQGSCLPHLAYGLVSVFKTTGLGFSLLLFSFLFFTSVNFCSKTETFFFFYKTQTLGSLVVHVYNFFSLT